jgi:hypothetical protein
MRLALSLATCRERNGHISKPTSRPSMPERARFFPRLAEFGRIISLPISVRSPTIREAAAFGGIHACCPIEDFPAWFHARHRARGIDAADGRPGLHPRAGASLQRRCVSALQRRDSRCRPRHGLHDQEQVSALSGMPGVLQTRARARGDADRRGEASEHQAGSLAKA